MWSDETRAHSCWENIGKPSVLSMSHSHRQRSVHHAQTCPLPRMVQTVSPESSDTIKCSTSLPTHQKPTFDFRDKGDRSMSLPTHNSQSNKEVLNLLGRRAWCGNNYVTLRISPEKYWKSCVQFQKNTCTPPPIPYPQQRLWASKYLKSSNSKVPASW